MQFRWPDLQPFQLSGAHVLDQDIRARRELQQHVVVFLQVQFHGELVASVDAEPDGVTVLRRAPAPERIAAGRLDLDDLGAEIRQNPRAERRRDVMAQFDHLQTCQRTWAGHAVAFPDESPSREFYWIP